jgi:hypothetical protein
MFRERYFIFPPKSLMIIKSWNFFRSGKHQKLSVSKRGHTNFFQPARGKRQHNGFFSLSKENKSNWFAKRPQFLQGTVPELFGLFYFTSPTTVNAVVSYFTRGVVLKVRLKLL